MSLKTRKGDLTVGVWAAAGFGLGFAPGAPGTAGTAGIAIFWGILAISDPLTGGVVALILTAVGIPLCGRAEEHLGKDAGAIVWDEFAGFAVAMVGLPGEWPVVVLAFALFRLFDISKLFPGDHAQRLPGGWGVVVDDLVAGVYANLGARFVLALMGTG
ncbi:MAG: phosphatidylglycerophosphatase A [bacterium]